MPTNSKKPIDSKLSALRNEQDSTAASNNNIKFPITPDDAFKLFGQFFWEVEKREIREYQTIYFFPAEERKKQKNNGVNSSSTGA
jgi:hypothetical protein